MSTGGLSTDPGAAVRLGVSGAAEELFTVWVADVWVAMLVLLLIADDARLQ
jgi:hypothetical protein